MLTKKTTHISNPASQEVAEEKQMSDAIFDTFVTAPANAAKDAPNIHDLYRSAKKHVKELYPTHKFIDAFGDAMFPFLGSSNWKTMDDVLAEDGNWEVARDAFLMHKGYSELLDYMLVPKDLYRRTKANWQAEYLATGKRPRNPNFDQWWATDKSGPLTGMNTFLKSCGYPPYDREPPL